MRSPLLISALALSLLPGTARAFSEDLCVQERPGPNGVVRVITNCMTNCAPQQDGSYPPECYIADTVQAAGATFYKTGRSMIHVDAVYFIARVLGFRQDVAYWLAAYDEVADKSQYTPFNELGEVIADPIYASATIDGLDRLKPPGGGPLYHFVAAHSNKGTGEDLESAEITGLYPWRRNGTNQKYQVEPDNEVLLANLRRWALAGSAPTPAFCTAGFTLPLGDVDAGVGGGAACPPGPVDGGVTIQINDLVPGPPLVVSARNQLMLLGAPPTDYTMLGAILDGSSGRLFNSNVATTVPREIAGMGFYLHSLADRVSHSYCTDDAYSHLTDGGAVAFEFDPGETGLCQDPVAHTHEHLIEVGQWPGALSVKTFSALSYVWDELSAFAYGAVLADHPEWFDFGRANTPAPLYTKEEIIGKKGTSPYYDEADVTNPGVLTTALNVKGGLDRLRATNCALHRALLAKGVAAPASYLMPGNTRPLMCP